MANKTVSKKLTRTASHLRLLASASSLGYEYSGGFEAAVDGARALCPNYLALTDERRKLFDPLLRDWGLRFRQGHVLRTLERNKSYAKRWGNYDEPRKLEAIADIMAKAEPGSKTATTWRTEEEHRAVKAANNALTRVRESAGLKAVQTQSAAAKAAAKKRRARQTQGKQPPVTMTALKVPHFTTTKEAVEGIRIVTAYLVRYQKENAKPLPAAIATPIADFVAAIKAGMASLKVSGGPRKPASAKAKANA